jgi:hypothetical protein
MHERPQTFNDDDESEVTLATPRFDADEARHAHMVVPLDDVHAPTDDARNRNTFRTRARRSWTLSLIIVALLAVAAVGGIATKVLRRARTPQPAPATELSTPSTPTASAPAASQSVVAESPSDAPPAQEGEREVRPASRVRSERAPRPEKTEEVSLPPEVSGKGGEDSDERNDKHHGRGKEKRRGEDGDDKDSRKASKHTKKGTRLVDVLKGP